MAQPAKSMRAFTLIEISIVLVIIGLIIGGVLVGRDLINLAAVRAQIAQFQDLATAVNTFKGKYACLPGDCNNASTFSLGNNGNGNETLEAETQNYASYTTPDGSFDGELPLFFIHLTASTMIKGAYDGTFTLGTGYPRTALNTAAGIIAAGQWQAENTGTRPDQLTDVYGFPAGIWAHATICMSAPKPEHSNDGCGIFTIAQARAIDTKMDDGKPLSGKIWSYSSDSLTSYCSQSDNSYLTDTGTICQTSFRLY